MTTPATLGDFLQYTNPDSTEVLTTSFSQVQELFASEPVDGSLLAVNNLDDVDNVQTSRENLEVPKTSTYSGDPNGHVAGTVGDFCVDTNGTVLYVCTATGSTSTAEWTLTTGGSGSGDLLAANNLSDVDDTDVSRQNLLAPKTSSDSGSPQGQVAGTIGDLYIDNDDGTQYICTSSGDADTAVWNNPTEGLLLASQNLADVTDIQICRQNLETPHSTVYAGDPNSNVAGLVGDFCIDTTDANALYLCTTGGNAGAAVWTLQGGGGGSSPFASGSGTGSAQGGDGSEDASGNYAFCFGTNDCEASGQWSFAMGYNARAIDFNAFAFGQGAYAGAAFALAYGNQSQATAAYSVAIGNTATTTQVGSWVIGDSSDTPHGPSTTDEFNASFSNGFRFWKGNVGVYTAGKGLRVAEGSNAKQGTVTLVSGVGVVANTSVTSNSRIFYCGQDSGVTGFLTITARTAATGFTVTSSVLSDTGVVAYEIFEPAS